MTAVTLHDLQVSVQDKTAFTTLADYAHIGQTFLELISRIQPTRIISPTHNNYIFYQYDEPYGYRVTRPLNTDLFMESSHEFELAFARFMTFLADVRQYEDAVTGRKSTQAYIAANEINKVVYTVQQSIGSVGDSFGNPNQSRKRIGQLFETLIKLIIQEVGLECEPRTIKIPIPGYPDQVMPYELDLVFSRNKALVTAESGFIDLTEIVGSVKTTSKDRIDKIFLDKFLLTKLLGREVPVVAIFLHDVQRAVKGKSIFGVNSTFKSNHFLGYTVALNSLDGVYYVDPRPDMIANQRLREQIADFQTFLVQDLWRLSG
ncbi:MAG: hypothetical protein HND44_23170 [Chloroflexi bacterium]|nr:hypothetical protein [Ardenticatenaceae bacterium]MBL1131342.1 hypothetical protein [Chloroflexota bacterium]NOG37444.1 hypothetical protein [Chloroflexota bacterium]